MDNGQQILVEESETNSDFGYAVTLTMPRERAELLFHDVNRILAILDEVEVPGRATWDAHDQGSFDRTNEVLALLQRELVIEPKGESILDPGGS